MAECRHVARTPMDDPDDISELLPRARAGWTRRASDETNRLFRELHGQGQIRVVARCETCGDLIFQRTAKHG
jgi:hypothetical protein